MNELEFEKHLSARLHRRFDGVEPSAELRAGVDQALSTRRLPVTLAMLRPRRRELGLGAMLAAGLVLAITLAGGRMGEGPGAPSATPQGTDSGGADRHFIVLPPPGYEPDKADGTLASDVLAARLRALLFVRDSPNAFTMAVGNAITFIVPAGGPRDDSIRAVLRAPGVISFVGLPATTPGDPSSPAIGQNPPDGATTLFGSDGVAAAALDVDQQGRSILTITLRPSAADAMANFTASHVGETVAIVIDDDVALLPAVTEAVTDGKLELSGGGPPGSRESADFIVAAAILVGGPLPGEWIVPTVPELLAPTDIEARLELEFRKVEPPLPASVDLEIIAADLDAILVGRRWTAVWRLGLQGLAAGCPAPLPSDERGICRWTDADVTHRFDAETGEWLGTAPP